MSIFLWSEPLPALALDDAAYDPTAGAELFTSFAGVGYIGLLMFLLFRLLQRRAQRATSQVRRHRVPRWFTQNTPLHSA